MRSLLGYLSPYVRSLELRVDELNVERVKLLDRILHVTTGAPLDIPSEPEDLTPAERKNIRKGIDKIAEGDAPFGGYPTMSSLLAQTEAKSFELDAGRVYGEPVEDGADVLAAEEHNTEETTKREKSLRRDLDIATATASHEYLHRTKPVELGAK